MNKELNDTGLFLQTKHINKRNIKQGEDKLKFKQVHKNHGAHVGIWDDKKVRERKWES